MTQGPARIGAWEVVRPLGAGGMGSVFLVEHAETRARRALKLIRPGPGRDLSRARREVEALARVDGHPNVVRVHDCGELEDQGQGALWLVLDLAEGGDLAARLARGPLPVAEVVALGRGLARGLEHVHARGVLHRDLKPANVLFDERGAPKLVDFGVARVDEAARLTRTGDLVGTPQYLPPEAVDGGGRAPDARTDVWGLGVVLYEALTGAPPIEATTLQEYVARVCAGRVAPPSSLRPEVPRGLERVVLRALEPDLARRWPSAAALGDALDALDAEGRAPGGARARLVAAALGVALLVLVTAAALRLRAAPPADPAPAPGPEAPAATSSAVAGPDPRLEPAAVAAALAREEAGPVLAALEARRAELLGERCPAELRAALAGALLVADDRAALARWRAAAGAELRATLDGVDGLLAPRGDPGRAAPLAGHEGAAQRLRAAQDAPVVSGSTRPGPLLDALEQALEAAERRLGVGPLDVALRLALVRLVLARDTSLAHAARRSGADEEDRASGERTVALVERTAALPSVEGPARVALQVLRSWLAARRPGEGARDPRLEPPGDAEVDALPARYRTLRFAHLARRFVILPDTTDPAVVAAQLERWPETLDLARALELLTDDGAPTESAPLEDTPRVTLAVDALCGWADLLGYEAWFARAAPDAERRRAEALAAAARCGRANFDQALFLEARARLAYGDLDGAAQAVGRVELQRREDGVKRGLEGELALLRGDVAAAAAAVADLRDGVEGGGLFRAWGQTLGAAVAAAQGDDGAARAQLDRARAAASTRTRRVIHFCPWRTIEETARQVEAARAGWRPWVAGRPGAP